jgi:Fe-S oxidoreductase
MLKSVYACSMCGACDIACKLNLGDMVEPVEILRELRVKLVEDGQTDFAHMALIDGLKKEDNTFGKPKADRHKWAEGLAVKDILEEKAEVFLHVGCQLAYDEELWPVIRGMVAILQEAGVDFGVAQKEEVCCGGRAYEIGYKGELENYAESMLGRVKESGAKTLLTCCSDGYGTFKQLYPRIGQTFKDVEVLHITEYIDRLMKEGKIKFTKEVPLSATYHDPCHLGRLGEPYIPWDGTLKKVMNNMIITDPEKEVQFGVNGVYNPPRDILKGIPGLEFVEMERIREYTYCCGAGGGAKEAYPDFALMAARERIEEAKATGADALVTACPWCERNFKDAVQESGEKMEVYDIIEIVLKGMGKE